MSVIASAGIIVVAATLGVGSVTAGAAAVTAQRASAAADAAALAAADVAAGFASGSACDAARRVAEANGVSLSDCTLAGSTATVTVTTTFVGIDVVASARAGPAVSDGSGVGHWSRVSDGVVTSGFGPREAQCTTSYCSTSMHEGLDFSAGCGAPIYAAQGGVVVLASADGGFGNHIRVEHGAGLTTGYAHIQDGGLLVAAGDVVIPGQIIALEGDTGNSFGCHVHFEVLVDGVLIDPLPFLQERGVL